MKKYVERVYNDRQCCSCGLCIGICKTGAVNYKTDRYGFLQPVIDRKKCVDCKACINNCPGTNYYKKDLVNDFTDVPILYGCSKDEELHKNAASGGIVTELLKYILENDKADYCVVVKEDGKGGFEAVVTDNVDFVEAAKTSKYCPVRYGKCLNNINPAKYRYAVVGLPCQIASLRKYYKKYNDSFIYISLMCNHMPSENMSNLLKSSFKENNCNALVYRGDGWPGNIKIIGDRIIHLPYRDTMRLLSNYFYNWRCKVCNDPFGIYSDITVGDAYFVKANGQGNSACLIYSDFVGDMLKQMKQDDRIELSQLHETYKFFKSARTLLVRTRSVPVWVKAGKLIGAKEPNGLEYKEADVPIEKQLKIIKWDAVNRFFSVTSHISAIKYRRLRKKIRDLEKER